LLSLGSNSDIECFGDVSGLDVFVDGGFEKLLRIIAGIASLGGGSVEC
jgi:hypothetical protein